ncbi:hypothetical protein SUGI_1054200 [Cryptomeria japonica]|nr:hypothetical protein SUGI_1054200 [Cryptomeria japonica]
MANCIYVPSDKTILYLSLSSGSPAIFSNDRSCSNGEGISSPTFIDQIAYGVLGPRNGYLPLLVPLIKLHFQSSLPPGIDTVRFDYKGLPLKWPIEDILHCKRMKKNVDALHKE